MSTGTVQLRLLDNSFFLIHFVYIILMLFSPNCVLRRDTRAVRVMRRLSEICVFRFFLNLDSKMITDWR